MLIGRKYIGSVAFMGGIMNIPTPFVKCWQQMIEFNSEYFVTNMERIFYTQATVSYHSFARNSLVDQMQGEWLLMLDTDIIFEPDIVVRMLRKMNFHGIDVMVAPYVYKSSPHPPVLYGYNRKKREKYIVADWDKKADLIPIRGSGAGCLLVRKSVFDKIRIKLHQSPFDIYFVKGDPISEDHSFFERLWKLRIGAYFSPTITVRHLKYRELDVYKDYDPKLQKTEKVGEQKGFGIR